MGWLEEHVKKLKGSSRVSWSKVARELRSAPSWKGLRITEASLATYLGSFDKGKDLHLLGNQPRLRGLLADYLHLTEEDLNEQILVRGEPRERQRPTFTIWDASTRPIDLGHEPLPAAFPGEVLDPRAWAGTPVLWRAPNGSGRTLVGEWHRAQGKALFIEAESWNEAQRTLPPTGRVFIELKSPSGLPPMQALPAGLDVCVAVDGVSHYQEPSPFQEGPREERKPEHTWRMVDSPPVEEWLEDLVFWLEERRTSTEGFDPKACLEWLQTAILPLGFIDGFETAIGFVSVYAEHGKRIKRGSAGHSTSLLELARYFLRVRLHRVPAQGTALDFNGLWALLLQIARHLLVHGEQPWFETRPMEAWLSIVRIEPDTSEVIEWLSQPTVQRTLKLSPRDIQKASELLPPEAFQRVRKLQQLFLLREHQPGLHALRPSWVFAALLQQGADSLLQDSPERWGEALLHAFGAAFVIDKLVTRCRSGDFEPIHRMLAARAPQSPAWVAALESSFAALGWTLLNGDVVPEELVTQVFDLQQQLSIEVQGVPVPRILSGYVQQGPLLGHGHWLLAAHALAEKRRPSEGSAHPVLDPWAGSPLTEAGKQAVGLIWSELFEQSQPKESRLRVLELYGRLFRRVGLLGGTGIVFQLPELLLERFQAGALTLSHVKALGKQQALAPLLRPYVEARGQSWALLVRAIWQAWLASKEPLPEEMSPRRQSIDLWPFISAEAILDDRLQRWLTDKNVPYETFQEEQWNAFLNVWSRSARPAGFDMDPALAWRSMPEASMRRALADDVLGAEYHDVAARRAIWKKAPGVAREGLRDYLKRGKWQSALGLVQTAPPEEAQAAVALVREGLGQPGLPRAEFTLWLHKLIRLRVPGWREALALLGLLDEAVPGASEA